MPSFNDIDRLAQRARQEPVPAVYVANRVVAPLAGARPAPALTQIQTTRSLALAATLSATAAAPAAYLVFYIESVASDPWIDLLYAVTGGVL